MVQTSNIDSCICVIDSSWMLLVCSLDSKHRKLRSLGIVSWLSYMAGLCSKNCRFTRLWAFSWAQTWLFHSVDSWGINVNHCSNWSKRTKNNVDTWNVAAYHIYWLTLWKHQQLPNLPYMSNAPPQNAYSQLIQKLSKVVGRSSPPPTKNNQA